MPDKTYTTYKDLKIWQQAMELSQDVYQLCEGFSKKHTDLAGQVRFSAVQLPTHIASGWQKKFQSKSDYINGLRYSLSKLCQLETLLTLSSDIGAMEENGELMEKINHLTRMMISMITKISHGGDPKPNGKATS